MKRAAASTSGPGSPSLRAGLNDARLVRQGWSTSMTRNEMRDALRRNVSFQQRCAAVIERGTAEGPRREAIRTRDWVRLAAVGPESHDRSVASLAGFSCEFFGRVVGSWRGSRAGPPLRAARWRSGSVEVTETSTVLRLGEEALTLWKIARLRMTAQGIGVSSASRVLRRPPDARGPARSKR
jgi:hypothetical protein